MGLSPLGRKGTGTFFGLDAWTQRDHQTGRKMSLSPASWERFSGGCGSSRVLVYFARLVVSGDLLCYAGDIASSSFTTNGRVMPEGTIEKLTEKGFGFISLPGGKDIFFHSSNLEGVQYEDLHEGQKVSFVEGRGPKGPRAEQVKPV